MLTRISPALLILGFIAPAARGDYPPPAEVKAAFLKLLDRPRDSMEVHDLSQKPLGDHLILETLWFYCEKLTDQRVYTYLVRPAKITKKLPAVIVLHGTGGSGESQIGFLKELAKRGIIGVAIDARWHGKRAGGIKGSLMYTQAIIRAWKTKPGMKQEHPFYYDTCWDLWRTVDYLITRKDIDPKNLGMIGFSMGGIEAWLAASVDDRIKVTVPAIAVQSFRWSLENDQWQGRARTIRHPHDVAAMDLGSLTEKGTPKVTQKVCRELWNKVVPGILDQFDCPSMIRLFAGRPLLILNGEKDANCPLDGAKLAFAEAEKAFKAAGAGDKLRIMVAPGVGHSVTAEQRQAAFEWFERWLK
ncbi:MAG TPA: alpha/beta fold hydrolase [Gemmataceae bacterium]|nr:alpha/beta fold hydrolase [Gemmataceae bacterium]